MDFGNPLMEARMRGVDEKALSRIAAIDTPRIEARSSPRHKPCFDLIPEYIQDPITSSKEFTIQTLAKSL